QQGNSLSENNRGLFSNDGQEIRVSGMGVQDNLVNTSDAPEFICCHPVSSGAGQENNAHLLENRQKLRADELRREYHEEQRNEFENFVEEQNDEQEERSRETIEQWRQWHYDGLYPSYLYNRHHI
ncbi:hypothetical protein FD755_004897, partial [Muntiacus reevesi]